MQLYYVYRWLFIGNQREGAAARRQCRMERILFLIWGDLRLFADSFLKATLNQPWIKVFIDCVL